MKCQKCDKPATFHITELTGGKPRELHLCQDHASDYLSHSSEEPTNQTVAAISQHMAVGQTANELEQLDQQTCPICGITFYEFRSQGRLGCPNDYLCFQEQLEPLILNIHGEYEHHGKRPRRCAQSTESRTELIRLRREMEEAVAQEDYERASVLRDQIQQTEKEDAD